VDVAWPEFDSTPLQAFVEAVAAAEELPPLEKFKLYAKAFKLEDIDDLVEALTDDDGNWIGPTSDTAAQSAVDRFRAGQDPAEVRLMAVTARTLTLQAQLRRESTRSPTPTSVRSSQRGRMRGTRSKETSARLSSSSWSPANGSPRLSCSARSG
jgi:hypothetical protein